jgi:hypothetical protein
MDIAHGYEHVCNLNSDVSEHFVCSIFIGAYEDGTDRVAFKLQTPVNHPKKAYNINRSCFSVYFLGAHCSVVYK